MVSNPVKCVAGGSFSVRSSWGAMVHNMLPTSLQRLKFAHNTWTLPRVWDLHDLEALTELNISKALFACGDAGFCHGAACMVPPPNLVHLHGDLGWEVMKGLKSLRHLGRGLRFQQLASLPDFAPGLTHVTLDDPAVMRSDACYILGKGIASLADVGMLAAVRGVRLFRNDIREPHDIGLALAELPNLSSVCVHAYHANAGFTGMHLKFLTHLAQMKCLQLTGAYWGEGVLMALPGVLQCLPRLHSLQIEFANSMPACGGPVLRERLLLLDGLARFRNICRLELVVPKHVRFMRRSVKMRLALQRANHLTVHVVEDLP